MLKFLECIRSSFIYDYDIALKEGRIENCSLPWLQNVFGLLDYKDTNPCNHSQYLNVSSFYNLYMSEAGRYQIPKCPGIDSLLLSLNIDAKLIIFPQNRAFIQSTLLK